MRRFINLKIMDKKEKINVIWAMKNGDVVSSEGLISGENYVKYNFK